MIFYNQLADSPDGMLQWYACADDSILFDIGSRSDMIS